MLVHKELNSFCITLVASIGLKHFLVEKSVGGLVIFLRPNRQNYSCYIVWYFNDNTNIDILSCRFIAFEWDKYNLL